MEKCNIEEALELYNKKTEKIRAIEVVFNDFFGKDNVDFKYTTYGEFLQQYEAYDWVPLPDKIITDILNKNSPEILVRFPEVTVTNEYDQSITIKDLYVKIRLNYYGHIEGTFSIIRSHYTENEFLKGYIHSHVPGFDYHSVNFTLRFGNACLGTGPIRATVFTLSTKYSIDTWQLFCLELLKYVQTESVKGGPYKRLEYVLNTSPCTTLYKHPGNLDFYDVSVQPVELKKVLTQYFKYVITSSKLKFNYCNGNYSIAMSFEEFVLTLSNGFIEWYNKFYNYNPYQNLIDHGLLVQACITEKGLGFEETHYPTESLNNSIAENNGKTLFKFKGNDVNLIIEKDSIKTNHPILVLRISICVEFLQKILTVLNYRYGRETYTVNKKVKYL